MQEVKQLALKALFSPKTVALIGAKDDHGSVGRTLLSNLQSGGFSLFAVNPKRSQVLGMKCYPDVNSLPSPVDLAVIATPAKTVPKIIRECVNADVKSCVVITAGFKEMGESGEKLEEEITRQIKRSKMAVVGPNCLGIMNPFEGLNATFAKGIANKGHVAFISQSGALCTAVLDWSFQENIGFSAFVSIGSMIDVGWGDLIEYFGRDLNTHSILLYMETVGDAKSFLSAARKFALKKPIVVIKPGRTQAAARAAASHTGSMVGNDAVCDAAFEKAGILRVDTIAELFDMAEVLAKQPLPQGPNLGIVTNAGGPAVLATDAALQSDASVPNLSDEVKEKLSVFLPSAWSRGNPVDLLGDASPDTYEKAIKILLEAPECNGILTILTPQDMTEPLETAKRLAKYQSKKPLLASWMGAEAVADGIKVLNAAGISTFEFPDEAASAFAKMWRHRVNLQVLEELPGQEVLSTARTGEIQAKRVEQAQRFKVAGKKILSEAESKEFLSLYRIPVVETRAAETAGEAQVVADAIGYPVVLKILSSTITHKSDVGGVKLNLRSGREVKDAFEKIRNHVKAADFDGVTVQKMVTFKGYELILGSSIDPQFGPVILFGAGGEMVEIYQDTALGLPPLGPLGALNLIKKTKIYKAFKGFRGKRAVDKEALLSVLVNFSAMILENPWIKESDLNPLLAGPEGVIVLDARIVLDVDSLFRFHDVFVDD